MVIAYLMGRSALLRLPHQLGIVFQYSGTSSNLSLALKAAGVMTVTDPSDAVVPGAVVTLVNPVSGFIRNSTGRGRRLKRTFHGLGDHASNSVSLDGQPITDQQSKVFSNQIPSNSIQLPEVISGAPPADRIGFLRSLAGCSDRIHCSSDPE